MKGFTRSRTKLSDSDKNLMPFRAFVCSCRKSLVYLSFSAPTFVCPSGKVCPSNIVKVRNSSPVFRAHHDLRVYEEFLLYLHLVISLRSSKLVTKLLAHTHTEFLTKNDYSNFFFHRLRWAVSQYGTELLVGQNPQNVSMETEVSRR